MQKKIVHTDLFFVPNFRSTKGIFVTAVMFIEGSILVYERPPTCIPTALICEVSVQLVSCFEGDLDSINASSPPAFPFCLWSEV